MQGIGARFVYMLRSDSDPSRHYVGRTSNVDDRLEWHNHGPCGYTLAHRPWSVVVSLEFPNESAAARFEKYLKSGSGIRFPENRFLTAKREDPFAGAARSRISESRSAMGMWTHSCVEIWIFTGARRTCIVALEGIE